MKMRVLSAALVLCAAAVGLTGTAHAAEADRVAAARTATALIDPADCDLRPDFLMIFIKDAPERCFANAGTLVVNIYDVMMVESGNNSVRITYKTLQGRESSISLDVFGREAFWPPVAVTKIEIF
ncbi:Beta/Gamma crystallin [Allokutzneria albata]|uniref:Beta/Gamma crystallin n=1 Tax=Allokutzneria albata TaxID=211114 RepID=A0A1G9Z2X7_ALLAB|nr:Beta/Gamma crystallin [Allokutzneria albata]